MNNKIILLLVLVIVLVSGCTTVKVNNKEKTPIEKFLYCSDGLSATISDEYTGTKPPKVYTYYIKTEEVEYEGKKAIYIEKSNNPSENYNVKIIERKWRDKETCECLKFIASGIENGEMTDYERKCDSFDKNTILTTLDDGRTYEFIEKIPRKEPYNDIIDRKHIFTVSESYNIPLEVRSFDPKFPDQVTIKKLLK